jgi:iron(III) transport system ATP-binding protein
VSTDTRPTRPVVTPGTSAPVLHCADLNIAYDGAPVLRGVSLDVEAGQLVALLGASGSGKSTLLHAVAGLVELSAGEIWMSGRRVADPSHHSPPEVRDVGMVFQNFALWPHLRVIDTVAYPLRRRGRSRQDARMTARALLDGLGIGHVAEQRPGELSGGEQQRVGLARALAREARLYLLDEPTAHLDTHLRTAFQQSVLARRSETGAAIMYATHDAAEALAIADHVAVIEDGRLIQWGTPADVYAKPVNAGAAALSGPCSVLSAHRLVRPDWVTEGGPLQGEVRLVAFRGAHTDYHVEFDGQSLMLQLPGPRRYAAGDAMSFTLRQVWVLPEH